jgi:hypothetical protein
VRCGEFILRRESYRKEAILKNGGPPPENLFRRNRIFSVAVVGSIAKRFNELTLFSKELLEFLDSRFVEVREFWILTHPKTTSPVGPDNSTGRRADAYC